MKKATVLVLALALLLALSAPALAFTAQLSPQKLSVDGKNIECEKYNIDGSNYFKLRDIAYLLNGTGSQFSVGWDAATKTVSIVSGEAYVSNGSELVVGEDKSSTAVKSAQTIMINGAINSELSVYNLDGNNFFKLRDLGSALGFDVDYDASTNTAVIMSHTAKKTVTLLSKVTDTDAQGNEIYSYAYSYDEHGNKVQMEYRGGDVYFTNRYTYDAQGSLLKSELVEASEGYGEYGDYTYDDDGNLLSFQGKTQGMYVKENYTYDADGNKLSDESEAYVSPEDTALFYSGKTEYSYDKDGNLTKELTHSVYHTENSSFSSSTIYLYDSNGNLKRKTRKDTSFTSSSNFDGESIESTYVYSYSYDSEGRLLSLEEVYNGSLWFKEVNTYDDAGNLITQTSGYTDSEPYTFVYTYDALGNVLTEEYTLSNRDFLCIYTYDAAGNLIQKQYSSSDGSYSSTEYEYITVEI